MKKVAILAYNAGNTASVTYALKRLGVRVMLTDEPESLIRADRVIFPGVGQAFSAMAHLQTRQLNTFIPTLQQPVLGICLGMQLMCRYSEEGKTPGMSIFNTVVQHFPAKGVVPHMGWNSLSHLRGGLFKGIPDQADLYFVHSYYAEDCVESVASCNYLLPFSAALQQDNFYGVQFHPEKSGDAGVQILENFLNL